MGKDEVGEGYEEIRGKAGGRLKEWYNRLKNGHT